jgi:hypothetical protein
VKNEKNIRFKKTNVKPNNQIKFDFDLLKLYLAIDEDKSLIELFKESQLEPAVFKKYIIKLIKMKLIKQVITDDKEYVDKAFLNRLRQVLIDVSGPLGDLLIEEAAEEMNFQLPKIPISKVADFVYQIATTIPGDKQASEFKKIMIQEIWDRQFTQR